MTASVPPVPPAPRPRRRASLLVAAVLVAACGGSDDELGNADSPDAVSEDQVFDEPAGERDTGEVDARDAAETEGGVGPASGVPADELADILDELEAEGFCDPADVENDGTVTAMHFVADGRIQEPCYTDEGADDPRLLDAWAIITDIAPVELYDDVSLFAGYEGSSDTLAFVTTLDQAFSFFLMAVDVTAGDRDPDELRLTMLHELTHVFAQHPDTQLDVSVEDAASCDTFFNGNGCFYDGAYIDEWIESFWTPDMLDGLPSDGAPLSDDESFELCLAVGGFTGAYAATHPEEDFAESFTAFVFGVDLPTDLDDKLDFFERYPEFVEIRDNAADRGLSGLEVSFDLCE